MFDDIYFHNTLSNHKERFTPQAAERVTLYVCGPTVYGPVHVGNARPAVVFDMLFRLLRRQYGVAAVRYARNITDIDDKIIAAAAINNEPPATLAARWHKDYHLNMQALSVLPPTDEPCATDYLPQMLAMIETLVQKKHAYEVEGHVLFHVSSYANHGVLSNRCREDMLAGARVEVAPYKRDPADFVLWKPSPPEAPGWDSPWGRGRPGWHIECSAMAAACLGKCIDIHGGGQDLIFPHHENEIAQSCCVHDTDLFARYWLHNGHVNIAGEKMSKSIGNVRLLGEALRQFPGEAVRYALLSAHYRSPLNWTSRLLEDAKSSLDRLYRALPADNGEAADSSEMPPPFVSALADDLNTPLAFSVLHDYAHTAQQSPPSSPVRQQLKAAGRFLGFFNMNAEEWFHADLSAVKLSTADIEMLVARRQEARVGRDFSGADRIRSELAEKGVILEDAAGGTTWRRK